MEKIYSLKNMVLPVFMLLFSTNALIAQPWQVTGTIQTQNVNLNPNATFNINEPLPGITVRLFDGEVELDSDETDISGAYTLEYSVAEGELRIEISGSDAFQTRELTGIPTGDNHDEGARNLNFKDGSVFYQGVRYRTVEIGDQVWMAENLRATHYRNGDEIPNVTDNEEWGNLSTGAFSVHGNDGLEDAKVFNRGLLYNWFAVADERGICPPGWDVPTDDDFKSMEESLGMPATDLNLTNFTRGRTEGVGNKLRSTSGLDNNFYLHPRNMNELANNSSATNKSGFSTRGTSVRFAGGGFGDPANDFEGLGRVTHLWTSSESSSSNAFRRVLSVAEGGVNRNSPTKNLGLAVRCVQVQDNETTSLQFNDTDGAGWRMLSIPFYGITVSDLAGQNQVSGIPGANAFYSDFTGDLEALGSNLFTFDPSTYDSETEEGGWIAPENFDTEFSIGNGFLWYFYDNDADVSVPLDGFNLSISGVTPNNDITVPLESGVWNLVGNPFASNITASSLENSGIQNAAQIYNSAEETYQVVNFSGSNTIAAWQGFFIENNDAESFTFPESARTENAATFYGVSESQDMNLIFSLIGEDSETNATKVDRAISLFLSEDASQGWDRMDLSKLSPLSQQYANLSFIGERNGEYVHKAQESQPLDFDVVTIPMSLELSNFSGSFTLEWEGLESIPEHINLVFNDELTGVSVDLRSDAWYQFTASEGDERNETRFSLTLSQTTTDAPGIGSELPKEFALNQNYPNPFNPTTQINYDLPQQSDVRLEVFNIQGQRVATLVNTSQNAGSHSVTFDASNLASGVYIYRLQASTTVLNKKMTLIK